MAVYPTRTRRWTRVEYDRLIELGIFQPGEHLELLGGDLVVSEPPGSLHSAAIGLAEDALRACFGPGWLVRVQMSIALDDESEPEPDVAVNLVDRVLEVHRDPARGGDDPLGWRYEAVTPLEAGASMAPLARRETPVDVGALFPRRGYR